MDKYEQNSQLVHIIAVVEKGDYMEIDKEMTVSIGKAAEKLGVSVKTLRRWSDAGKINFERTPTGHRRYYLSDLQPTQQNFKSDARKNLIYARVSSHDQKNDLERQIKALENFCASHGWEYEIIKDLGSGLNYKKKGLRKLIKMILSNQVERIILTHRHRLLRFGAELIFSICDEFDTEVVIINKSEEETSFESELVKDMIELVTVFSATLYGSRSHKNKKVVNDLVKYIQKDIGI